MEKKSNTAYTCPSCGAGNSKRKARKRWMKLLPYSKRFACSVCSCEYVTIFSFIKLKTHS